MTEIMPFPENNYETVLLDRPFRERFFMSKNFVFVDVGAGAHTGPTVESPDFANISHNFVTFVKGPMRASAPTNGFFDTLNKNAPIRELFLDCQKTLFSWM